MTERIGIVGAGHWSRRLNMGIQRGSPFEIHKTLDVLTYDQKADLLRDLDIPRDRHYAIDAGDAIPDEFFEGLDVVQIASPIEYHARQTLRSLEEDVLTITEKSFGASREEFDGVVDRLREDGTRHRCYLHLHYLKKLLTKRMPDVLDRVVAEHGPVRRVEATFVEERSEEDRRRSWLFEPGNGGVLLDWIHPIEVLATAAGARFDGLRSGEGYLVNSDYTERYPTAARAEYDVSGDVFGEDATATVRVGKGFRTGTTHKVMRFVFEDARLDFKYVSSEVEFETDHRGEWVWTATDGEERVVDSGAPEGPIPYMLLIDDIEAALDRGDTGLELDAVDRMFEPVWMFNDAVGFDDPVTDREAIDSFVDEAIAATGGATVASR
jgi:predicted dehydrogenase